MTADAPERIWITPCHPYQGPDDYYLLHPDHRNGRGTEYVRADLATPTPAQAAKVLLEWAMEEFIVPDCCLELTPGCASCDLLIAFGHIVEVLEDDKLRAVLPTSTEEEGK